jgi:hypothetical protein
MDMVILISRFLICRCHVPVFALLGRDLPSSGKPVASHPSRKPLPGRDPDAGTPLSRPPHHSRTAYGGCSTPACEPGSSRLVCPVSQSLSLNHTVVPVCILRKMFMVAS